MFQYKRSLYYLNDPRSFLFILSQQKIYQIFEPITIYIRYWLLFVLDYLEYQT